MKKTNAARLLDSKKISYDLVEYHVDEADLSAAHVAESLGQNVEQVFKTLVLRGKKTSVFVAVIPGAAELNLKKSAKVSGNKSVEMVLMKELLGLTGYIRGACSPMAMKKPYPIYVHKTCLNFETIFVSAGKRGMQIKIDPKDLITCTGAEIADLIDE
ncbi:Cys-tRNA(Pro) deacylase [Draconibacterium halophilum]|uniref:Cys-tRNA(Pro)/Cys-tRNA(Cys) deacylase n=1 Tax=Draconibacterium halophilum TaxID=2706887 RepID=A0A6C0R8N3_9BACT|nr:Cys-tRNA(Pro) deacylase [Draconibacterium halophilum]QIA06808.1 Cys-tRNA(Pro) deacylase [Draconibacterium halophilum]